MYRVRLVLMVMLSLGAVGTAAVLALSGSNRAKEDEAARGVIRQLADSDPDVRRDASEKLKGMAAHALPALREACTSPDTQLARRARKLLDEMEGRTVAAPPEPTVEPVKPVAVEPSRPAVEIELMIPKADVRLGEAIRFYVRMRNNTVQPVLVGRHRMRILPLYREFAQFEIVAAGEEPFVVATELWPRTGAEDEPQLEFVAVPAGATVDLYAGQSEIPAALHTRLLRTGEYAIRFVYDAAAAYRDALAKARILDQGVPLPAERIASNAVTVTVQP